MEEGRVYVCTQGLLWRRTQRKLEMFNPDIRVWLWAGDDLPDDLVPLHDEEGSLRVYMSLVDLIEELRESVGV